MFMWTVDDLMDVIALLQQLDFDPADTGYYHCQSPRMAVGGERV